MLPVDQRKEMLLFCCKPKAPGSAWFLLGSGSLGVYESSVTCPLLLEPKGGGPIVKFVFSCCTHAHTRALIV